MADLSQHRRTPAEIEALTASAAQCGHTFATIESALPGFLARLAERELKKAYGKSTPAWRPLTRRTDPTIGRKRRARRARGRRIAARRNTPYVGGQIWLASARSGFRSYPPPKVMLLDEVDSFPTGELTIEQWADARQTIQRQQGEEQADG
jgi:hypothetical protein